MVIRMRHTRATTGDRRSHHALKGNRFSACVKCGTKHLRHHACGNCGTYRGKEVVDIVAKLAKSEKKKKAKESVK
ncbi:MAG: 50S ribosomal protein L32 [Patescibacteria group bacterium]